MERECHPLLKGRKIKVERKYNHVFSKTEIVTLASICEVFIPCLPMKSSEGKEEQATINAVQAFFKSSASQDHIPDEVLYSRICQIIKY